MSIDANYASPNLRWAVFLEDHPGTPSPTFELCTPAEAGVPEEFAKDADGKPVQFVRCTINPPGGEPLVGIRETTDPKDKVIVKMNAATWQVLCTKALGRTLKRAGYPDDIKELKALMHWRERTAEVRAIGAGEAPKELTAGSVDAVLDEAGRTGPEAETDLDERVTVDPDTGEITVHDDEIADAEIVDPAEEEMAPGAMHEVIRGLLRDLTGEHQKRAAKWWKAEGIPSIKTADALTVAQADAVLQQLEALLEEQEAQAPFEEAG